MACPHPAASLRSGFVNHEPTHDAMWVACAECGAVLRTAPLAERLEAEQSKRPSRGAAPRSRSTEGDDPKSSTATEDAPGGTMKRFTRPTRPWRQPPPQRRCVVCGEPIVRKRFASGLESLPVFEARQACSRTCGALIGRDARYGRRKSEAHD